jgi:hypothetical protein
MEASAAPLAFLHTQLAGPVGVSVATDMCASSAQRRTSLLGPYGSSNPSKSLVYSPVWRQMNARERAEFSLSSQVVIALAP